MNIWTTSSIGLGYSCTLSQLITLKVNQNHEIIGELDPASSKVGCHFSEEKILLSDDPSHSLLSGKNIKNLLKNRCMPIIKGKVLTLQRFEPLAVSQEMVLQYCNKAIQRLRFLVQRDESNVPETWLCPITCSVFEDPVIDGEGHTFEKSAIEQHLQRSDQCPIGRELITSLSPNRVMKDLIEKMREEHLIPLLPSMCGKKIVEDRTKANRFLELAKTFEGEGDYKNALAMYAKAFDHTNQLEDYEVIPSLFIKEQKPLKAALAYLYLIERQIQEGILLFASLENVLKIVPHEKTILALKAFYLLSKGGIFLNEAAQLFSSLAQQSMISTKIPVEKAISTPSEKSSRQPKKEELETKKSTLESASVSLPQKQSLPAKQSSAEIAAKQLEEKEAMRYWEYALHCCPSDLNLYDQISACVDKKAQVRLFLIGFSHFYEKESAVALQFYEKARSLEPQNPMIYFARLSRLPKNDPEKINLYRLLSEIFIENQQHQHAISCFNKVLAKENTATDIQRYVDCLIKSGNLEKAEEVTLQSIDLLYGAEDAGILKAMERFGRKAPFLEKLFSLYVKENNLNGLEKLVPELASHYEKNRASLERVYRLAHEKLSDFAISFKFGEILVEQNKKEESLRVYYDLSLGAYNKREMDKVSRCLKAIQELKNHSLLSPLEQQSLLMQNHTVELFQQMATHHQELMNMTHQQQLQNLRVMQEMQNSTMGIYQQFTKSLQQLEENHREIKAVQQRQEKSIEEMQKQLFNIDVKHENSKILRAKQFQIFEKELLDAATSGDRDKVKNLLAQDMDINRTNHLGETALSCAIKNQHLSIAKLLLQNGSFVTPEQWDARYDHLSKTRKPDRYRSTQIPLALAIETKNLDMVKLLVEYQALVFGHIYQRIGHTESHAYNCLDFALKVGSFEIVHYLFVHSKANDQQLYQALASAIQCRFIEVIRLFLKEETFKSYLQKDFHYLGLYLISNVETMQILEENSLVLEECPKKELMRSVMPHRDFLLFSDRLDNCWTPLHWAACGGYVETMKFLLEKDPNLISKYMPTQSSDILSNWTFLQWAAYGGHVEAMKFLLGKDPLLISKFTNNGYTPLHAAAYGGHVEAMKFLLEEDPSLISKLRNDGMTPLHEAAYGGHVEAMKFLLKTDPALISKFKNDGYTPLHGAAEKGHIEAMKFLLEKDPLLISKFDNNGWTPLHAAAHGGIEAMKFLLEKDPLLISKFKNDGSTPFHFAAYGGHVEAMKFLLEKDLCFISKLRNDRVTPLHYAAYGGHVEAMNFLLEQDPNLISKFRNDGYTPFHEAASEDHVEAMKFLLKKDPLLISKFKNDDSTPLHSAASEGHVEAMKFLLEKDPLLISKFKNDGSTPFHFAAYGGHVEAMKFLLEKDPCFISKLRNDRVTPLHLAASGGHVEAMKFLLEKDPFLISKFRNDGSTPLHWAAEKGHVEAMKFLLEKDPFLISKFWSDGSTPLHWAASEGHIEAMKLLLEKDSNLISKFKNDGSTPLHEAAEGGHVEAMKFLLEKDSNLISKFKNDNAETPLHCAASGGHVEAMKFLLEKDPNLISKFTNDGVTPFHSTAYGGHVDAGKWLYQQQFNLLNYKITRKNSMGNRGWTALDIAQNRQHVEFVAWIQSPLGTQGFKATARQKRDGHF